MLVCLISLSCALINLKYIFSPIGVILLSACKVDFLTMSVQCIWRSTLFCNIYVLCIPYLFGYINAVGEKRISERPSIWNRVYCRSVERLLNLFWLLQFFDLYVFWILVCCRIKHLEFCWKHFNRIGSRSSCS